MAKYGRLNEDTVYFLKGTEFEITNEDDGFYTDLPFYQGWINGMYMDFDQKDVDIIYDGSYSGKVIEAPQEESLQEQSWEYTNYP